ncbi:MAG: hypothetical protein J5I52_00375 [Saprospiraceae bacterium]|nr:MAG: hypothetical protein UZ09_BCD002001079 [Bacteroidetes bacterium OLB9]MCO6462578.1 hypothetical protein [Saprospiraceae bacterium]MCZ2337388.1 hypothetical protein [Chitinophagales bacterium]
MKQFFSLFGLIALLTASYGLSAQKTLEKGSLTMEITKISAEDPQMEMGLSALKGSQTEMIFDQDKYMTISSMMGGMVNTKVRINKKENAFDLFMDAMGNKMWVESKLDESQTPEEAAIAKHTKIVYDKNDTKEILGYKCYKATITNPEMDKDMEIIAYVTPDIKASGNMMQGFQSVSLDGLHMEFTMKNPQFSMTFRAVDIKDTVDESKFNIDTKGYKKMTMEEFKNSMGNMGGF